MWRFLIILCSLVVGCADSSITMPTSDADRSSEPEEMSEPAPVTDPDMQEPTPEEPPDVDPDPDEPEPIPQPDDVMPCAGGDCWETALGGPPCATDTHDEDFSSGNYNVHAYSSMVWDGAPTHIALTAQSGAWEPVLVVRTTAGETLFDGDLPAYGNGIELEVESATQLTITSDTPVGIIVYVTSRPTLTSNFVERIATDVTYSLQIESDCGPRMTCTVNGNNVRDPACGWLHYVGRRVVPALPGSRAEQLRTAALVAWWALKEGVMFLDNPILYSNCNFPDGDARIGALDSCVANRAWQVGLSGVQVPYHTDAKVEGVAQMLYPDLSIADVLRNTAVEARLGGADVDAVVNSTGTLRRSWLLRNSAVGFVIEAPVVEGECVDDTRVWCYGTGWDTTALYAPNRSAALGAIEDVEALLGQLAP